MGTLRDQLLRAGLVTKKQKEHQERRARKRAKKKRKGHVDAEEAARLAALEEERRRREEEQARRVEEERRAREEHERRVQVKNLIARQRPMDVRQGRRRFHYPTRDGRIGWLWMTDTMAHLLEVGEAAIVEDPFGGGDPIRVVDKDTAARLVEVGPDWIRFWNGSEAHAGLPVGGPEQES